MNSRLLRKGEFHICGDCDLVIRFAPLRTDQQSRCPRCRSELERGMPTSPPIALAVALTAAELWVLMNVFPLVELSIEGISRQTTLAGAALSFFTQGMPVLSALVALTAIAAPGLEIGLAIYMLVRLEDLHRRGRLGIVVRWLGLARRWSMVDVFLLGCMVAIVKLSHLAQLVAGPALWSCAALIPLLALLNQSLAPRRLAIARHD